MRAARLAPLFLLAVLAGCDANDADSAGPGRLVLMLNNEGTGRNPSTVLFVRTEGPDGCGYALPLDASRQGNTVRLRVSAPKRSGLGCGIVPSPSRGTVSLGLPDGEFLFLVRANGQTDAYRLTVRDEQTTLAELQTSFSRAEGFIEG